MEVDRQRTAIDVPPARRGLLLSGGVVLRRGVCRRERLFHVFQRQCQLLGSSRSRAPEAMPLQLLDDCGQPLELLGMMRPLGQEQSTQAIEIGGEGITAHRSESKAHHRACVAPRRASESPCRVAQSVAARRVHAHGTHSRPVKTFKQRRELR